LSGSANSQGGRKKGKIPGEGEKEEGKQAFALNIRKKKKGGSLSNPPFFANAGE